MWDRVLVASCWKRMGLTGLILILLTPYLFGQSTNSQRGGERAFAANQRLGRGINLGNFLEAPRGADWGVRIEEGHFKLIRDAGFDSVRLPVRWSDYALNEPPYTIESELLERVTQLLDAAHRVGLNVVLNSHHYQGLDEAPEAHRPRFVALWKQLTRHFEDAGDWLYFELHNEPHGNLTADKWNRLFPEALTAVRQVSPERMVIVGPDRWNNVHALRDLQLPDDPFLIVTVHMYEPFEFTHQGATWTSSAVRDIRDRSWGTPQEVKALHEHLRKAAEWGKQHGRPIFVGEFGAYHIAPMDSRVRWTREVARTAESLGMSWAYWEFAAGFGIYDLGTRQWRQPLLQALLPSAAASSLP
ncbi:MAG: endoglucanase [Pirellulaceae bacterium]|nr:MAG: endoglucanase [Pirellulaceae bacterium]